LKGNDRKKDIIIEEKTFSTKGKYKTFPKVSLESVGQRESDLDKRIQGEDLHKLDGVFLRP